MINKEPNQEHRHLKCQIWLVLAGSISLTSMYIYIVCGCLDTKGGWSYLLLLTLCVCVCQISQRPTAGIMSQQCSVLLTGIDRGGWRLKDDACGCGKVTSVRIYAAGYASFWLNTCHTDRIQAEVKQFRFDICIQSSFIWIGVQNMYDVSLPNVC